MSSADVKTVLDALQNGNSVRVGDLGSFRLTIKTNGVATAAEAKRQGVNLIREVSVQFTKSATMRDAFAKEGLDFGQHGISTLYI